MAFTRLSRVLRDQAPGNPVVAFGREGDFDRADCAGRVAALAAAIEERGRGRWLVFSENSYAAAVSLLAILQAGSTAVLAPNRQSETLRRLSPDTRGAILDPGVPLEGVVRLAPLSQPPAPAAPDPSIDRNAPFVEFHTSGTTGNRRGAIKALCHLEDEVETLEDLFGPGLTADARIFATVSHQHIYGLLFRVLWPLATGRPFTTDTLLHPQELLPRMVESGSCALVSTPAHLRRAITGRGLRTLEGTCRTIFSSGSMLEAETAKRVTEQLGFAPLEILGSTETGGVALRQQSIHGEAWSAFPGVRVEREAEEGRMVVSSPFASEGEAEDRGRRRFTMGDRIELRADGTFLLLGRADRTAKVGGKRLSIPDMERELAAHEWVAEAALVVLERASEARVHAVIVPSETGRAALQSRSRREFGAELARHLSGHFEPVLLPRVWRVVDELPRDAQGKLPVEALEALFETRDREPRLLSETREAHSLERRLEVPAELAYLEGHFENVPVVAGVVLLRWIMSAAADLIGRSPRVLGIEALKFPALLRPGQRLTLCVEVSEALDRLRFRASDGDRVFAIGRCPLVPPAHNEEAPR
jgi:acyl-coenzyme A synthetase/AMP-(fatty) acid ligase